MIKMNNICNESPYLFFKDKYDKSLQANQHNIDAICISSFSKKNNEVNSRYVNLKFISDKEFIFFSNYESPKSLEFKEHSQISALIFWSNINVQIRMKAKIKKTSNEFNQKYFFERSKEKNALALSSDQSNSVDSYNQVLENYNESLKNDDLKKCPKYWGGFSFIPYYFEFWKGHESRLNKREVFDKINGVWKHSFLQP
jgi:pyridoxamine 5'-phosphate oxidase